MSLFKNYRVEAFSYNSEIVKVNLYLYSFAINNPWRKRFERQFLKEINKEDLKSIFETYRLPKIDLKRKVRVSPFLNIPVIDIILFSLVFLFIKKLLNTK